MHLLRKIVLTLLIAFFAALSVAFAVDPMEDAELTGVYQVQNLKDFPVFAAWGSRVKFPLTLFFFTGKTSGSITNPPENPVRASVNVFLFESPDGIVMIDAGDAPLQARLSNLSLKTADISHIMLTHLHPDHVGSLLTKDGGATYENAKIHLSQTESDAVAKGKGKMHDLWLKIQKAYQGRVVVFRDGADKLPGGLRAIPAPGHTPGHTVYVKILSHTEKQTYFDKDGDLKEAQVETRQSLYFVGDLVHAASLQFAFPDISCKFDANPVQAAETRKKILSEIAHGTYVSLPVGNQFVKSILYSAHVPFPGAGSVLVNKNGFIFVGVEK